MCLQDPKEITLNWFNFPTYIPPWDGYVIIVFPPEAKCFPVIEKYNDESLIQDGCKFANVIIPETFPLPF